MSDELDKDLEELISRVPAANKPEETVTPEAKAELERKAQKVPGLDLTFLDLEALEITEEEATKLAEVKKRYSESNDVHLVRTVKRPYLVRECKRIEWRNKVLEIQSDIGKIRQKLATDGKDQDVVENILDMVLQEKIVSWLLVHPTMEVHELRTNLPPGEVETLFKCIMMAQGFGQNIIPIKI
jgi:hypothetical protein